MIQSSFGCHFRFFIAIRPLRVKITMGGKPMATKKLCNNDYKEILSKKSNFIKFMRHFVKKTC